MEIENLPEAKALEGKSLKETMNRLFDCMTSSEFPSDAADKMKDLVRAKAPKNISQFIKNYFDIFDDIHQKFLDIQCFLNSSKYFSKNKNEVKNSKNFNKNNRNKDSNNNNNNNNNSDSKKNHNNKK
jgi:hypothetical protein